MCAPFEKEYQKVHPYQGVKEMWKLTEHSIIEHVEIDKTNETSGL